MENKPNNPSAFPLLSPIDKIMNEGMSLRDYFANSAMQGILSGRMFSPSDIEVYVEQAYKLADAMLKEREK